MKIPSFGTLTIAFKEELENDTLQGTILTGMEGPTKLCIFSAQLYKVPTIDCNPDLDPHRWMPFQLKPSGINGSPH